MRIRNTAQRPWNSWNVGFPWWVFGVVAPKVCSAGPAHQGWRDGNRTGSTTTPVAAEHNGNLRPQVLARKCENVWNIRISTPTASTTSRSRKMNILYKGNAHLDVYLYQELWTSNIYYLPRKVLSLDPLAWHLSILSYSWFRGGFTDAIYCVV